MLQTKCYCLFVFVYKVGVILHMFFFLDRYISLWLMYSDGLLCQLSFPLSKASSYRIYYLFPFTKLILIYKLKWDCNFLSIKKLKDGITMGTLCRRHKMFDEFLWLGCKFRGQRFEQTSSCFNTICFLCEHCEVDWEWN